MNEYKIIKFTRRWCAFRIAFKSSHPAVQNACLQLHLRPRDDRVVEADEVFLMAEMAHGEQIDEMLAEQERRIFHETFNAIKRVLVQDMVNSILGPSTAPCKPPNRLQQLLHTRYGTNSNE